LNPDQRFNTLVQDTLRGSALASMPFVDQDKVIDLLDRVHTMDEGARVACDQTLMSLLSMCVLQERLGLGVDFTRKEEGYEAVFANLDNPGDFAACG
jgi:asparagine synthase (glutamine-hydrolysing)